MDKCQCNSCKNQREYTNQIVEQHIQWIALKTLMENVGVKERLNQSEARQNEQ